MPKSKKPSKPSPAADPAAALPPFNFARDIARLEYRAFIKRDSAARQEYAIRTYLGAW